MENTEYIDRIEDELAESKELMKALEAENAKLKETLEKYEQLRRSLASGTK